MGQDEQQKLGYGSTPLHGIRCVLWGDPAGSDPNILVKGLTKRGASVCIVWDEPSVMVELATAATKLLVIDQIQHRLDASRLTAAVGRYFPAVLCKKYIVCPASGRQQLVDIADTPVHDDLGSSGQSGGLPAMSGSHASEEAVDDDGQEGRPLVTQQEMSMLIGEVPIDATLSHNKADQASE